MSDDINKTGDNELDQVSGDTAPEKTDVQADNAKSGSAKKSAKTEKPKKPSKGNPFVRMGKGIKRFCKDFRGELKKIIWPGRQMVIKSTGVVLSTIIVVGAGIWIVDFALSGGLDLLQSAADKSATTSVSDVTGDTTAASGETTAASDETTAASDETTAASDETTAAPEETTAAVTDGTTTAAATEA